MWRHLIMFFVIGLLLVGCGSTKTFEGRLDSTKDGFIIVNCSDEVNKGKGKNINGIGYLSNVELTDSTKFHDDNGVILKITDFPLESNIRVVLLHTENIKKIEKKGLQLNLVAKEIILLNQ